MPERAKKLVIAWVLLFTSRAGFSARFMIDNRTDRPIVLYLYQGRSNCAIYLRYPVPAHSCRPYDSGNDGHNDCCASHATWTLSQSPFPEPWVDFKLANQPDLDKWASEIPRRPGLDHCNGYWLVAVWQPDQTNPSSIRAAIDPKEVPDEFKHQYPYTGDHPPEGVSAVPDP